MAENSTMVASAWRGSAGLAQHKPTGDRMAPAATGRIREAPPVRPE